MTSLPMGVERLGWGSPRSMAFLDDARLQQRRRAALIMVPIIVKEGGEALRGHDSCADDCA